MFHKPRPIASAQTPPNLHGGFLLNRMPKPQSWKEFTSWSGHALLDGKHVVMVLELQPTTDATEAIEVFLLVFSMTLRNIPLAWETVPENIRRHFKLADAATAQQPPPM